MARDDTKFIRPLMTDVGRGPEIHQLSYPRRGAKKPWRLPPEGATVPWNGAEGHFWQRRLNEKAVEIVEPDNSAALRDDKTDVKPSKRKIES